MHGQLRFVAFQAKLRQRPYAFWFDTLLGRDVKYHFWRSKFQPQDAYGLEKLATEELCKHYTTDFGIECRIGRFHNIYGPFGTWKGKLFWLQLSDSLHDFLTFAFY